MDEMRGVAMIEGSVFVTPHAVRQFQARIAPLPYEVARTAILAELEAHALPVRPLASGCGVAVRVRGGRYVFRALIGPGDGPCPAVITILRSGH